MYSATGSQVQQASFDKFVDDEGGDRLRGRVDVETGCRPSPALGTSGPSCGPLPRAWPMDRLRITRAVPPHTPAAPGVPAAVPVEHGLPDGLHRRRFHSPVGGGVLVADVDDLVEILRNADSSQRVGQAQRWSRHRGQPERHGRMVMLRRSPQARPGQRPSVEGMTTVAATSATVAAYAATSATEPPTPRPPSPAARSDHMDVRFDIPLRRILSLR